MTYYCAPSEANKRVGFVASCFDLLHAGHCLMLQDAKKQCDWLIAGLHIDPSTERNYKNKPVQSLDERRIQLESIKYVDQIELYKTEKDLLFILEKIKPNVRVLGSDYKKKNFTGMELGMELGIEVYYHERNHNWSTTDLRIRIQRDNGLINTAGAAWGDNN